jgi:RNA polymerase sigma-70 factor (ECF subfamily)
MAMTQWDSPVPVDNVVQGRAPTHDDMLVEAYATHGDHVAFSVLVERHHRRVFRLVSSVLGPGGVGDAQDITQDVFVALARHLTSFRHDSAFTTWLRRVALNMALDRRRHPRWRLPHVGLAAVTNRLTAHATEDQYGLAAANDQARRVARSLRTLPSGIRRAVYLRYWVGLSAEEISTRLQIPTGTVKSRLHRGRTMLRQLLPTVCPRPDRKLRPTGSQEAVRGLQPPGEPRPRRLT